MCSNPRRRTARRATTATHYEDRYLSGWHLHRIESRRLHRERLSVTAPERAIRPPGVCSNPKPIERHRPATTGTSAPGPTPVSPGSAPARVPSHAPRAITCHGVGTCDPATGVCSNPPRPDGTSCNDANACTGPMPARPAFVPDRIPSSAPRAMQCHDAGTCNPATGVCSKPNKTERHRLQRWQRLHADRCLPERHLHRIEPRRLHRQRCVPLRRDLQSGDRSVLESEQDERARPAPTRTPAPDRHLPGRGLHRTEPRRLHRERCVPRRRDLQSDHRSLLESEQAGGHALQRLQRPARKGRRVRPGSAPDRALVVCAASDACHGVGTCNPSTGVCSNPNKPNGTTCNDGNPCTQIDTCQERSLHRFEPPLVCTASDACHTAGTCNPATGACSNPSKANGTTSMTAAPAPDRSVSGRRVRRLESGRLHGECSLSHRGLQRRDGDVLDARCSRTELPAATTATRARPPTSAAGPCSGYAGASRGGGRRCEARKERGCHADRVDPGAGRADLGCGAGAVERAIRSATACWRDLSSRAARLGAGGGATDGTQRPLPCVMVSGTWCAATLPVRERGPTGSRGIHGSADASRDRDLLACRPVARTRIAPEQTRECGSARLHRAGTCGFSFVSAGVPTTDQDSRGLSQERMRWLRRSDERRRRRRPALRCESVHGRRSARMGRRAIPQGGRDHMLVRCLQWQRVVRALRRSRTSAVSPQLSHPQLGPVLSQRFLSLIGPGSYRIASGTSLNDESLASADSTSCEALQDPVGAP